MHKNLGNQTNETDDEKKITITIQVEKIVGIPIL